MNNLFFCQRSPQERVQRRIKTVIIIDMNDKEWKKESYQERRNKREWTSEIKVKRFDKIKKKFEWKE